MMSYMTIMQQSCTQVTRLSPSSMVTCIAWQSGRYQYDTLGVSGDS